MIHVEHNRHGLFSIDRVYLLCTFTRWSCLSFTRAHQQDYQVSVRRDSCQIIETMT
jgi:hypothetical protein